MTERAEHAVDGDFENLPRHPRSLRTSNVRPLDSNDRRHLRGALVASSSRHSASSSGAARRWLRRRSA
jgi:hypothetical protein